MHLTSGLTRGVSFGGSGLIRKGLLLFQVQVNIKFQPMNKKSGEPYTTCTCKQFPTSHT